MKNAAGRDIPDELLGDRWPGARNGKGYEPYQGAGHRERRHVERRGPRVRLRERPQESKLLPSIREAILRCGPRDGMTVSFHHHFRDGDHVVNAVMEEIVALGAKDVTIAASSLGIAHGPIARYIEQGIVTGIQTSGIRGEVGEAVSRGKLRTPAILRSHGGRVRAIEEGDVHIDIAFIGAPTSDDRGNARAVGGKSDCGVLSYAMVDAAYADHVVVITDTLVPFPNFPASIHGIDVDWVVEVETIGDPKKIASAAARMTRDPRELMMAETAARVMAATPWFRDGFSFQTGAGGPSLAVARFLEPLMVERGIRMGWAIGGTTGPICELQDKGLVETIVDTQAFDVAAIQHIQTAPRHFEISTSEYASPANKGAFVDDLGFVVLAALEVDVGFNVNVITGSDGVLRGAPGGHPDTAAGSKCCIIVAPLVRGRMPTIRERVTTLTTPGEHVDVVITDHGLAVSPKRRDIIACLDEAGIRHVTIQELQEKAYSIVGRPDPLGWGEKIVAIMEARDGTILDVVREIRSSGA